MKKRFLALLLVLTMVFSLMPAALAADTVDVAALPEYAADADISTGAAYKISTEESLRAFAAAVKADDGNGTYAHAGVTLYLAGDIALTGTWTPVGSTATYVGDFFAGTFDGCGHTISGLNVQGSKVNQGLFAAINKATIRNLNVSGTVSCGTKNYVGGIVGKVQAGTIENCSFSGSVTGGYTGGIAGGLNSNNVTISGCANLAVVTGTTAGGILGYWKNTAAIRDCYNTGSVTGSAKAGGIVGQLQKGSIENCYSTGDIGGKASQKGGIFAFSNAAVKNCYYTLPEAETLGGTAAAATQITSPEGLADKLGNAFKEDTAGANNGYPILVWQAGEVVQPDPRIELTGSDTLWRTTNDAQPQTTITAACKDMDEDTHVDWTLTEGEGIATAEERLLKADASALTLDTSDIRAATTIALPATGSVNGSAITWESSDSNIIDPATGAVTLPGSGIRTVTLTATLTRGEATACRNFDIRVWSQAELDKEAAKSELQKLVERLDGTVTLTPEYGRDTNVNTMLSAKIDDSSIAVSVSKVEEVYGGAGIAADGTITYFYADPNTAPLQRSGSYRVTFALSKAGATETLQVPVVIGWDVQRVRDTISAEITSQLTTESLCAAGDDPNLLTQDLTLPKVIDGKRWALISWTSSDPTAISVSDKNQQTADTLFDPYVGVVKTPTQDTTVTLTATVTFQLTDAQEQTVTVSKVFTVTVKGQQTNMREQLLAKLDAGFASYGGLRDAVTGLPLTQRDGKYLAANDIHFPTTRDFGVDGKYTPVTIASSDTDTIVPPDVNNAARAEVYRPLPGEAAKDVTVTVTITDSDSGVSASRSFLIAVQPLTQQEIDAELALMAAVKAHYFDGIRNANTDAKNILTDLHPFREAYLDADGQLVWVYDHADLTGSGIVPVAMDGWTESEQWRLFRSTDPDVISHENLLVTRAAGDKTVTVSSELSSETLGKYAARYPDNKDFQALSCQPVSVELTVPGTEPVTPSPVDPTPVEPDHKALSVTFQLHTDTEMWISPSVIGDLPEGTTAMDVFRQVLAANGYSYEAKGSYVQAVIKPDGTKVAEFSKGPNSGWVFRVNGEFPDVAMQDCRLSDGDVIEVFFTADYMDEPGMFLPFTDVTNHWAYSAIKRVYTRGWMVGMDEKTFAPDQQLSRAMLAVILYAMAGEPAVTGESPFTDVPAGCWYTDAIVWAAQNGIVCGFGDGTFRPNEAVTRAQAAVMLYGYAAFTGADVTARADLSAYSDAGQIPAWAMDAMQWANARRLIVGRDSSHLAPNGGATRAEMAAILSAYIGK